MCVGDVFGDDNFSLWMGSGGVCCNYCGRCVFMMGCSIDDDVKVWCKCGDNVVVVFVC